MVKSSIQAAKEKIEVKKEDEWEDGKMKEKTGDAKRICMYRGGSRWPVSTGR